MNKILLRYILFKSFQSRIIMESFVSIIFEFLFVEVFGKLISLMFRMVYLIGVGVLKFITRSEESIDELKLKYKDSSKPYFLGFGLLIVPWIGLGIMMG